jgi:hypothetical protein
MEIANHIAAVPTGLSEALWACVLDDYLSEEEQSEVPWMSRSQAMSSASIRVVGAAFDLRDARSRRGTMGDSLDENEHRYVTSITHNDSVGSQQRWFAQPPEEKTVDMTENEPDWDENMDWDTTVQPRLMRKRADVDDYPSGASQRQRPSNSGRPRGSSTLGSNNHGGRPKQI